MARRALVGGSVAAAVTAGYLAAYVAARQPGRLSGFRSLQGERRYDRAYRAVLDEWPVPCQSVWVPTPFGDTHILTSGPAEAPPVVLLHATDTSATGWRLNVGPLSQEHRVFAVDILGEAGRSRQTAILRDRRDWVDWVSAVLDGLGLERASLVGWSFGGWATMAFVIAHPQRVNRCVLLAPFGSLAPYAPAVLTFLKVGPYLPMGPPGRLALRMMSPGYHFEEHFARQFALGGRYFRAADPRASAFPQPYDDAELRSISVPVLLLVGDRESTFDPHRAVERAQALIPRVEMDVLPGIGHMLAMEAGDVVNARMLAFLDQ